LGPCDGWSVRPLLRRGVDVASFATLLKSFTARRIRPHRAISDAPGVRHDRAS
jgi:hypothetical protein